MVYHNDLVSVIIPCFNQGHYLNECIDSVLNQTYYKLEIIVINDGSTNQDTKKILSKIDKPKTRIINTDNQGLAMARNNGIKESNGNFIIPLDCDDLLSPYFIEQTIRIAQDNKNCGVVYTDAIYFGDYEGVFKSHSFDFLEELYSNHILATALVRREAYDQVKKNNGYGYNLNIPGYEDWDMWISIAELGWELKYLDKNLFYYRKAGQSMVDRAHKKRGLLISNLIENHSQSFTKYHKEIIVSLQEKVMKLELLNIDLDTKYGRDIKSIKWLSKKIFALCQKLIQRIFEKIGLVK